MVMICLFTDMMKLQRAKEQNDRQDAENRALRERVHTLESEKKNLLDQVDILLFYFYYFFVKIKTKCCCSSLALFGHVFVQLAINDADRDVTKEDGMDKSEPQTNLSGHEKDYIHKR